VKLGEALSGDKDARKLFSGLGLSPEELTKLPMERQMESLGAALGHLGDRNRQAAEAQAIFGRGYTAMIPVLDKLRTEGYDKLREKVAETAGVLSGEMSAPSARRRRKANEAGAALSTALAPTNLKLLKSRRRSTSALADNAGTIQSAGSGLGTGFLTAAVLSQLVSRLGPQMNLIGSNRAWRFPRGSASARRCCRASSATRSRRPVRSRASPVRPRHRHATGRRSGRRGGRLSHCRTRARGAGKQETLSTSERARVAEFRALRDRINAASSPEDAAGGQVAAARLLSERQTALDVLDAKKEVLRFGATSRGRRGACRRPSRARALAFSRRGESAGSTRGANPAPRLARKILQRARRGHRRANAAQRTATDQTFAETPNSKRPSSIAKA